MVAWLVWVDRRGSGARSGGIVTSGRRESRGRGWGVAVVVTCLAVAVAACSGGGATQASSTSAARAAQPAGSADAATGNGDSGGAGAANGKVVAEVCGLLAPAELKAQLGIDFPAGTAKDVSGSSATCEWEAQTGQSNALVSLTVEAFDPAQWAITKKLNGARPVPGLGDDAVFGFLDVLNVKKGDRDFTIEIVLMPAPSAAAMDSTKIELAKLVLPRL